MGNSSCGYGTRTHPLGLNLMSTHSLGHQSSGFGFATSLSSKSKTHEWFCICNYKPIRLNHNHKQRRRIEKTYFQLEEDELFSSSLPKTFSKLEKKMQKLIF
ncbi:hypothetical protein H5410_061337 [Solanum commersonii]|uniref:Uncharacterized protein n=1 Tax=Solanum commersonii TaxID=4109 RepID=A0A9J5W7G1_SOLCO|nr:hypothetical protein H5410_061337 [Solanum commersonii]